MKSKTLFVAALVAVVGAVIWLLGSGMETPSDRGPPSSTPEPAAAQTVADVPSPPVADPVTTDPPSTPDAPTGEPSAAPPTPPRAQAGAELAGRVVAAEDGSPIEGATVSVEGQAFRERAVSDAAGRFALRVPKGPAFARAWAPGRVSKAIEGLALDEIRLERGRGVQGRLQLPNGGAPPSPCRAWAIGGDQLTVPRALTVHADGRFELSGGLGDERVAILAFCEGYATPLRLDWHPLAPEPLITLQPCGSVEVVGALGAFSLRPVMIPPEVVTGSARDGNRFLQLAAGSYGLEVEGLSEPIPVVVEPGQTQRVGVAGHMNASGPTSPLRVVATDRQGAPLQGATVVVRGAKEHEAKTDASGIATFQVEVGPLMISADMPGRVTLADATRDAEDRQDVTLVLAEETILEGAVFPNAKSHLRLTDSQGMELRSEATDDQGRFRLERIAAGDYVLEVESDVKVPIQVKVSLPLGQPLHVHLGEDYGKCGHEH